MQAQIAAIRAITAWQFRRIFRLVVGAVGLLLVVVWGLLIYAAVEFSAWWLIFLLVLLPVTIVVLAVSLAAWWLSGRVLPRHLTRSEQKQIADFNDKLLGVLEDARTPAPLLTFMLAGDVLRGRGSQRIRDIIEQSQTLQPEFRAVADLFSDNTSHPQNRKKV